MNKHAWKAALLAGLAVSALAPTPAAAQGPYYEVTGQNNNGIEIRFHGVPLRGVHADDSQNALSLDFISPVDGALFDRLPGAVPQWVGMAYANYDNGVIRATHPVTYLTRQEPDGFSLRIINRGAGGPPMAQNSGPPPMRGQMDAYGPPAPMPYGPPPPMANGQPYQPLPLGPVPQAPGFRRYETYAPLRNYDARELAVRRADPIVELAYGRASMLGDSGIGIHAESNWFHGGDQMVTTDVVGKLSLLPGVALVGDATITDTTGVNTRAPDGKIYPSSSTTMVTGMGGLAFEMGADTELKLLASEGNNITGGRVSFYSGSPGGYFALIGDYHTPDLDTPTAVWHQADKDRGTVAIAGRLGYGLWGSASGNFTNYGIHGDSSIGQTAGWDSSLRWTMDTLWDMQVGLAYNGHGEYRLNYSTLAGAAPTPYIPLGLRNIEDHAVTASLSTPVWEGFWFSAYAGYVIDRYGSDGLLAGADLHYTPMNGVDVALGFRQSAVSYTQGETGRQTTAGLNLNLGFGDPPQPSWMSNIL